MDESKIEIRVSKHAAHRMRERLGISKSAVTAAAQRAWDRGARYDETRGDLRRMLDRQRREYGRNLAWRIYGEYLYSFSHEGVLITITCLKSTKVQQARRREQK